MIRYALICERDHGFEGWFGSSDAYEDQASRGLVECPVCGSHTVRKQIMAPAVAGTKRGTTMIESGPSRTMILEAMGRFRQHVKDNFDYVGDTFAKEARAIHEGTSEERSIYGEAKPEEVRALREDGVPIAALPPDPNELN